NRTKNACSYRFTSVINDDCSIIIKTDIRAVRTADFLARPYNDSSTHIPLLHSAVRQCLFHRYNYNIADTGVASTGSSQDVKTFHSACSGVVSYREQSLRLNHTPNSSPPARGATYAPARRRTTSSRRQHFVLLSGRVSIIRTISPIWH